MLDAQAQAIRHMYQTNFASFIRFAFQSLYPNTTYQSNWSIDLLGHTLERCYRGEIKRLIINMPPRSLKSFCTSVAFPAWLLALKPETKIISVAGHRGLADDNHQLSRQLMASSRYRSLFPHVRFNGSATSLTLPHGGSRVSTTPSTCLTGRGADFIIIDDPQAPHEAEDSAKVKAIRAWYDRNVYQRLNNKDEGVIILVMQRLAQDDLTAYLLEREGWEHLSLPAIATGDEAYPGFRGGSIIRSAGEPLHPAREDLEQLRGALMDIRARQFMAQYQQKPYPQGEGVERCGAFFTGPFPGDPDYQPSLPGMFFGRIPEERFVLEELFGERMNIRRNPPPQTIEEWWECANENYRG